eukprot:gene17839-4579_t
MTPKIGTGDGGHIDLAVSVQWKAVTSINYVKQSFEAEVDITVVAIGAMVPDGADGFTTPLAGSFAPRLQITNAIDIQVITDSTSQTVDEYIEENDKGRGNNSDVVWQYHVTGTFAEKFELEEFPIDKQELGIHIQPRYAVLETGEGVKGKQLCRLVIAGAKAIHRKPITLVSAGATVAPVIVRFRAVNIYVGHTPAEESKRGNTYSTIKASIVVERRWGYYVWNVVLPSFIFTSLAFLSLLIPDEDLADRLSVTLTLMLTSAAYKIVAANAVPDVPFLTYLDTYCVTCLVFSVLVSVQNAIVCHYTSHVENINLWSGISLLAAWLLYNMYTAVKWVWVRKHHDHVPSPMLCEDGVPVTTEDPTLDSLLAYNQLLKSSGAIKLKCKPTLLRSDVKYIT